MGAAAKAPVRASTCNDGANSAVFIGPHLDPIGAAFHLHFKSLSRISIPVVKVVPQHVAYV